jgi:hypothetical protein
MTTPQPQPQQETIQGGVILGQPQPHPQPQPLQAGAGQPPTPPSHIRLAPDTPDQPGPDPEEEAREIQALAEGITLADRVECLGKHYRIADKVGLMPLLKFAKTAKSGVDSDDLDGLVAIYDMLKDCIAPDEWDRFVEEMTEAKAETDELMQVVGRTLEILSARPTRPSTGSSPGGSTTGPGSTPTSSSVAALPEGPRVPDWARETVPVGAAGARRA